MRRFKQEITDKNEIEEIIKGAEVARLAINRKGSAPYIVPMNFGYREGVFYFHCAGEGLKLDLIREDPRVSVEVDEVRSIVKNGNGDPCSWGMNYRSVIATGTAGFITDFDRKKEALELIIARFVDENTAPLAEIEIRAVQVFSVAAEVITAKRSD